jgi:hypothetical protein
MIRVRAMESAQGPVQATIGINISLKNKEKIKRNPGPIFCLKLPALFAMRHPVE